MLVDLRRHPLEDQFPNVAVVHVAPPSISGARFFSKPASFRPLTGPETGNPPTSRAAGSPRSWGFGDFRPPGNARFRAFQRLEARQGAVFPHIFPQMWKTLGIDRTRLPQPEAERTGKARQCTTIPGLRPPACGLRPDRLLRTGLLVVSADRSVARADLSAKSPTAQLCAPTPLRSPRPLSCARRPSADRRAH